METEYFHAHQDIAYPIPGLVIVASRRHLYSLDELTPKEAAKFIELVQRIRSAQRKVLGIEHVYYFYNEDTTHHFHLWMVPRYSWMAAFGRSVESLRPALEHAREMMSSPGDLGFVEECVSRLRQELQKL